jgi:hypothetical protein
MKKKTYRRPLAMVLLVATEQLMIVASPGVGGGYNPHNPIDGKASDFFEEEEDENFESEGCNAFAEF